MSATMPNELSNGSHRTNVPGYFEWWYFHFTTDGKTTVNIVLHETDIFGIVLEPYVSLSVLRDGHLPVYRRRKIPGIQTLQQGEYLRVADDSIDETSSAIKFSVAFPDLQFAGEITKLSPVLAIQDGVLYEDSPTGNKSFWIIQVPHAVFEGELHLDGRRQRMRGMAYQDHSWGFLPIQDFVSDWIWGHFSDEQSSIVFYRIHSHDKRVIDRVAVVDHTAVFAGTELKTEYLNSLMANAAPERHPFSSQLYIPGPNIQLDFSVSQDKLMRSRVHEDYEQFVATYCRWYTQAAWRAENQSRTLPGLTEYIRIRRKPHAA